MLHYFVQSRPYCVKLDSIRRGIKLFQPFQWNMTAAFLPAYKGCDGPGLN